MYEVFDPFLCVKTWHTRHANDEQRYFECLAKVVEDLQFNPESFGDYIDARRRDGEEAQANLSKEAFDNARDKYVADAWAVKRFLLARSGRQF